MRIVPHDPGELHKDGRSRLGGSAEKAVDLFEVANVEGAQGIIAIGGVEQFLRGDAHAKPARFIAPDWRQKQYQAGCSVSKRAHLGTPTSCGGLGQPRPYLSGIGRAWLS